MGRGHGGRERGDGGPRISITFGTAAVEGGVVIGDGRPRGGVVIGGRERGGDWERLPIPGYPQRGPRPVFNGAADNRNFGPIMTQYGIDAAGADGPSLVLPYARRGFGESALPDGERVGILFNYDTRGNPVVGKAFDLNNPAQLNDYNQFKSAFIKADYTLRERGNPPLIPCR